ncbi:hypothetical protein Y032_0458g1823 [Ancylostoma ceylanicum]|uniref:Uncharacterized protein n=1 Tax=Ancylostoma ceylanicum TaxID=53326 RepID=A0A016WY38_9BILA|nr:hypothetical protein Y032_0458g1823 [Ancylostoma ceylanicum]
MTCVYCNVSGKHYSDACPTVARVADRISILRKEGRCEICVEKHRGVFCNRRFPCFYGKNSAHGDRQYLPHHASICTEPEEFTRTLQLRKEMKAIITEYQRQLEQYEAGPSRD